MEPYTALIQAARILGAARTEVAREDGPAVTSPAWRMLQHAITYLEGQANTVLRGEA